jgi:hypothetical protein
MSRSVLLGLRRVLLGSALDLIKHDLRETASNTTTNSIDILPY